MSGKITLQKYIGMKFGRLTVKDAVGAGKVLCVCDCGKEVTVKMDALKSGNTKSCGCYKHDRIISMTTKHGLSHHPLYKTWHNMRSRCKNPNATKYEYYGGKGISVCKEWDDDFVAFYSWSIKNGWNRGLSIDRIDSDGDYCPENCRWADYSTQNNNLSSNHEIEYRGQTHSVYEWAHILGISEKTFSERIRRGWSIKRAIETPVVKRKKVVQ